MRKSNLIPLLFLILISVVSCKQNSSKAKAAVEADEQPVKIPSDWLAYSNADFSVNYPPDWTVDTSHMMGTKFILMSPATSPEDNFQENLNYITEDTRGLDFEGYVEASHNGIKQVLPDTKFEISEVINLNGRETQKDIYTSVQQGVDMKFEQYTSVVDGKAHILTLTSNPTSFSEYQKTGELIFSTFKLK